MNFPQWLKEADLAVMELVNRRWSNGLFDTLMPWVRNQITWYPFYIFLAVLVLLNFGKRGFYWILGFVATVAITDMTSSQFFKNTFERIRPCRDPDVASFIILRIPNCSGGFSFTSSHAANHFGMATFIFITLSAYGGRWSYLLFLWAGAIAYAQVYVGVHYPLDVLGGTLIGLAAGQLTGRFFRRDIGLEEPGRLATNR